MTELQLRVVPSWNLVCIGTCSLSITSESFVILFCCSMHNRKRWSYRGGSINPNSPRHIRYHSSQVHDKTDRHIVCHLWKLLLGATTLFQRCSRTISTVPAKKDRTRSTRNLQSSCVANIAASSQRAGSCLGRSCLCTNRDMQQQTADQRNPLTYESRESRLLMAWLLYSAIQTGR